MVHLSLDGPSFGVLVQTVVRKQAPVPYLTSHLTFIPSKVQLHSQSDNLPFNYNHQRILRQTLFYLVWHFFTSLPVWTEHGNSQLTVSVEGLDKRTQGYDPLPAVFE